jgi:DNA polymerase III delta prime subunit
MDNKNEEFEIPAEYKYHLICQINQPGNLLGLLAMVHKDPFGNMGNPDKTVLPPTGEYEILGIKIFIVDRHIDGLAYTHFYSREECEKLYDIIYDLHDQKIESKSERMYSFDKSGWRYSNNYIAYDEKNYIGYKTYVDKIMQDVQSLSQNSEFLKSIGETNSSLNYLLYGAPGTGKTTLVKLIASKLRCPIYQVKSSNLANSNISVLLDPLSDFKSKLYNDLNYIELERKSKSKRYTIVLFEDFDRNIGENNISISDILNALDGIQPNELYIRFFTGNNCEMIFDNIALTSRLNGIFKYDTPNISLLRNKLYKFLTYYAGSEDEVESKLDVKKINTFLRAISDLQKNSPNITIRSFSNYVRLYLFNTDTYLDDMIKNIKELEFLTELSSKNDEFLEDKQNKNHSMYL